MTGTPFIPNVIAVHLGPPDVPADNVYVSFPDYIKNVASSEIYPTWPEAALRANIYAQISYALNRYYTEWYRRQGFPFDITNAARYDQAYIPGRNIDDNISRIVDEVFNSYLVMGDAVEPYFTQYCNGTSVTCDGMSQWDTVALAQQGLGAMEILSRFYGDRLRLVTDVPIRNSLSPYPGQPLQLGNTGREVQDKQIQLNRISVNYPGIPKIGRTDGDFGQDTVDAVTAFQRIFALAPDGVIGNATWNRISSVFNDVSRLSKLDSERLAVAGISQEFYRAVGLGGAGDQVRILQYYLNVIAAFYDTVPRVALSGIFDEETRQAVLAYQQAFGLETDGIVGINTWRSLYMTYESILHSTALIDGGVPPYPGLPLHMGSQGDAVAVIQEYLVYLARIYPAIPAPSVTGIFGQETETAVLALQRLFGMRESGMVDAVTWDAITTAYSHIRFGNAKQPGQYPGTELTQEEMP